jgi:hypothetical protein
VRKVLLTLSGSLPLAVAAIAFGDGIVGFSRFGWFAVPLYLIPY